MRRVQDGRLAVDEDGAALEPELLEDGLAMITGHPTRTISDALSLTDTDVGELEASIEKLEDYVARYLHQSYDSMVDWTWRELIAKVNNVTDIVRAENGKPPRGQADWNQTFT